MLDSLCAEHPFLRNNKARIALMMHVTSDDKERVILSCGFSMELNKEVSPVGNGIVFTSSHRYAFSQFSDERFLGVGRVCVLFSWVAIGEPYFVRQYAESQQQPGYATHFGVTRNGGFPTLQGAELDSPVVVSFRPELCCPFAVAEVDLKGIPPKAPNGH